MTLFIGKFFYTKIIRNKIVSKNWGATILKINILAKKWTPENFLKIWSCLYMTHLKSQFSYKKIVRKKIVSKNWGTTILKINIFAKKQTPENFLKILS